MAYYLNGYPRFHITKEYLVPLVTGITLCHINDGKTTILPLGSISFDVTKCLDSSLILGS
jgi:hypothetical protein